MPVTVEHSQWSWGLLILSWPCVRFRRPQLPAGDQDGDMSPLQLDKLHLSSLSFCGCCLLLQTHVCGYTYKIGLSYPGLWCVVMQTVAGQNKLWLLLAVVIKGQHLCKLSMAWPCKGWIPNGGCQDSRGSENQDHINNFRNWDVPWWFADRS